ncbi:MAG: hypothetical protein MZV70_11630 [Desulfobacterales bacterium]|nr:hypothetical protein [Desulfobacterales bacterium]
MKPGVQTMAHAWNTCPVGGVLHAKPATHERRNTMPLIQLVIVLVVVGVILWVINSYIPMQSTIKENIECGRGDCCDHMAVECLRTHRRPLKDSYREVKGLKAV